MVLGCVWFGERVSFTVTVVRLMWCVGGWAGQHMQVRTSFFCCHALCSHHLPLHCIMTHSPTHAKCPHAGVCWPELPPRCQPAAQRSTARRNKAAAGHSKRGLQAASNHHHGPAAGNQRSRVAGCVFAGFDLLMSRTVCTSFHLLSLTRDTHVHTFIHCLAHKHTLNTSPQHHQAYAKLAYAPPKALLALLRQQLMPQMAAVEPPQLAGN